MRIAGKGSLISSILEHRSGRIIALCRLVLALVFFLAVWIDPTQPVRASTLGYGVVGSYLAISVLLMLVAWSSWWWDHRLAWPVLALDVLGFLSAVFFTEGMNDDFTSPFLAFFTFLMLAATIRWDWRVTAITGIAVTTLYLLVGIGLAAAEIHFDMLRFGRRVVYMMVLSLILIWFGLQRREQHIDRFRDAPDPAAGTLPLLTSALAFAIEQSGARAGAIAWSDDEEPAIEVRTLGVEARAKQLSPGSLPPERAFGDKVRLFSADRRRRLRSSSRGRPVASLQAVEEPLADLLGIGEALAVPVAAGTGRGEVLLMGIPGVCADHVAIGVLIGRELQAALDRHATLVLSHISALARSREALARDLHDNVAQSLAGAALRLEGVRNSIRAGNDADAELLQLKNALRAEQTQVRAMIERLRVSEPTAPLVDLTAMLCRLVPELAGNWAVSIGYAPTEPVDAPADLAYEIANIVREAVANAVRHGQAEEIELSLERTPQGLALAIADNGSGFPPGTGPEAPRSIRERVLRRGGALDVQSSAGETRLSITLPMGEAT